MTKFNIGGYEISTKTIYDILKTMGKTTAEKLAPLDKNGDKKITEDELVELQFDDSESESDDDTLALKGEYSGLSTEQVLSRVDTYDTLRANVQERIAVLQKELQGGFSDRSVADIQANIKGLQQSAQAIKDNVRELLLQAIANRLAAAEKAKKEKAEAAARAAEAAAASSTSNDSDVPSAKGVSLKKGASAFASNIKQIALSYVGKLKESDGSYLKVTGGRSEAWCADFATYVVKQAAKAAGVPLLKGFGSASVSALRSWAEQNGRFINTASAKNKAKAITSQVKIGDLMIQQRGGVSHTGIVVEVYDDGSFDTVEGNTSDQCLKRHYSANSGKLSGFIRMS